MRQLFLILFTVFELSALAQTDFHCAHPSPTTMALKAMRGLHQNQQKSSAKRIFPVVFHVLHQGGSENIPDVQILNALMILNQDFQKLNGDTSDVVSPFDTIVGNPNFEFRLAAIDPNGNPTNGIDRIYSPLSITADDYSKINQWDPSKYINIWVVNSLKASGIAAYTYNPLVGLNPCTDGIVILHDYLGTFGSASINVRHHLTHEMGHFFGLFNLVEETNAPGVSDCDYDDGIADTPHQTGLYSCTLSANSCDDALYAESYNYWGHDVIDMVQNFMHLSYCMRFFTKDQTTMMRAVHENPIYGRWNLSDSLNLMATGVADGLNVAPFIPSAAFSLDYTFNSNNGRSYDLICAGTNAKFKLQNGNPASTDYVWSFPGGNPSTDTIINPIVNYTQPGYYNVTLTATSANGTNAETKNAVVYVSGDWAEYTGPTVLDLDANGAFWMQYNKSPDPNKFTWIPDLGKNNSGCFRLQSRFYPDTTIACWAQNEEQISNGRYDLITPAFDLRSTTSVSISFDYAHGSSTTTFPGLEKLKLFSSKDCGRSWTQRFILMDTALITSYVSAQNEFAPNASEWRTVTIPYTSNSMDNKTRFKIEFTASNESNYVFIDNFRIDGILGISDPSAVAPQLFPNPSSSQNGFQISGLLPGAVECSVYDLQGKIVYRMQETLLESEDGLLLKPNLGNGSYLLKIIQGQSQFSYKLLVLN